VKSVKPSPAPNPSHVVVSNGVAVPIIPRESDSTPSRSDNCGLIGHRGTLTNAVANFKKSGLIAGHWRLNLLSADAAS
jgi:hypothetical protein